MEEEVVSERKEHMNVRLDTDRPRSSRNGPCTSGRFSVNSSSA